LPRDSKNGCVLDKLIEQPAYYYEGRSGNACENIVTSVLLGNTLLTHRGIPVAEYEIKNVRWGYDGPAHPPPLRRRRNKEL
jgi:L-arabinose isomerase